VAEAGDGGALARAVLTEAALEAVRAHPAFPQASLAVMIAWAPHSDDDRALARVVRDLGQYICAVWAMQLYVSPGGLTHASLSRLLAPLGVATRTRVHAILAYLRFSGLIRPTAEQADGRSKTFEPTPALRRLFKARFRRELETCRWMGPQVAAALDRWEEPGVFEAVVAAHGRLFGSALEGRDPSQPNLDVFSNRNAGLTILGQVMRQACPDGRFPPKGPVRLSIAEIAREAGVSRAHAHNVLKAGRAAGMLDMTEDGLASFPPLLVEHLTNLLAASFVNLAWAAQEACGDDS